MESPCCSICIQRLDDKPKWRLSNSHKLLCDNCASKENKSLMTRQFFWHKCFSCQHAFPDRYYNCNCQHATSNNKDAASPFEISHACCARCLDHWNARTNGTIQCPLCRRGVGNLLEAKVCTLVEIPDEDDTASPKANLMSLSKEIPADLSKRNAAIKYVVKDVRGVRLGRKESESKVRIRWEDTWERSDWVDTRNQVKRIVKRSPGFIRIRWKDTWEPLEYLDNGMLREKAIMLLEEKFGL